MKSRTKDLITLTAIDVQSNQPEIAISMTSGLHTLKAITINQNIWETIGFLACELVTAPAPIRDQIIRGPVDLKPIFRFDIDSDLRLKMAHQYEEMGDCDLTRMNEDIINGFDEVNGNNAVSQSIGIANLAVGLSTGRLSLDDEQKPSQAILDLVQFMFYQDAWDPAGQGVRVFEGKTSSDEDIEFNVVHAVGNIYMEGKIGKLGIRVFKNQNIQAYIGWGTDYPDRPEVFQLAVPQVFEQRLHDMVEISANSPA
jgi:hypothetical protein